MRRFTALVGSAALATTALVATTAGTAGANHPCPGPNGSSLGVAGNMVVPIGVHPNVIYIDDRDIIGINVRDSDLDNEHAGGLWVYSETGVKKDLQRGGVHFLLGQAGNDAGFQDACLQGTAGERDDIVF